MSIRRSMPDLEWIASCLEDIRHVVTERLVPAEARAHFRQAEKEALLGVRCMLDGAISRLEAEHAAQHGKDEARFKPITVED